MKTNLAFAVPTTSHRPLPTLALPLEPLLSAWSLLFMSLSLTSAQCCPPTWTIMQALPPPLYPSLDPRGVLGHLGLTLSLFCSRPHLGPPSPSGQSPTRLAQCVETFSRRSKIGQWKYQGHVHFTVFQ